MNEYIKSVYYYECPYCRYKISALAFFSVKFAYDCPKSSNCHNTIDKYVAVYKNND